jgi:hypothetical protein
MLVKMLTTHFDILLIFFFGITCPAAYIPPPHTPANRINRRRTT